MLLISRFNFFTHLILLRRRLMVPHWSHLSLLFLKVVWKGMQKNRLKHTAYCLTFYSITNNSRLIFSAGYHRAHILLLWRIIFFRFNLVHSLFNILPETFLTSVGWFHALLCLLKVFPDSSCSAINDCFIWCFLLSSTLINRKYHRLFYPPFLFNRLFVERYKYMESMRSLLLWVDF